jgi:hypothetical protein
MAERAGDTHNGRDELRESRIDLLDQGLVQLVQLILPKAGTRVYSRGQKSMPF